MWPHTAYLCIAGLGAGRFSSSRDLIDLVSAIDGDGLFIITPYASAYTADEALAYFEDCAQRTQLPIMIYNCPPYSGVNIAPTQIAELSKTNNIVAIKEGNQDQLPDAIAATAKADFSVFTARDSYLLESLALGSSGVISFAANVAPVLMVSLQKAWDDGNVESARELQDRVTRLVSVLVSRSYPSFIKAAMRELGLPAGPSRRIETDLSAAERQRLRDVLTTVMDEAELERLGRAL